MAQAALTCGRSPERRGEGTRMMNGTQMGTLYVPEAVESITYGLKLKE
jgi:hypothetical protein